MEAAARFGEINLIADPLHKYIEITKGSGGEPGEQHLLDTRWLQRLRRIHQLQAAWWVFPTAEHSRFSHLLGAMHLAARFARRIDASLRACVADTPSPALVEETLRLAGLLHDVGHGPFGHFFDREVLATHGLDHEDVGRTLVTGPLADVIGSLRAAPSGRFAPGERVDPCAVAWVMAPAELSGYTPPAWLRACKPLLCGPATVDNLDYVPRDAYMCGVGVGSVDVERLIHYTFVSDGELVLHAHGTGALQMFLEARLFLYTNIYFHRTVRRIDLSMREIFADTIALMVGDNPAADLDTYCGLTDWSLLERVDRMVRAPADAEERRLGTAWARIVERRLPWKLAHEAPITGGVEVDDLPERIRALLPAAAAQARFEIDVASASVAPLNPMAADGMVAIYDPLRERIERSRTTELVARLPRHNRLVRVFTEGDSNRAAVGAAAREALDRG